jgi:phosphopantothenoylcysteine decarboxylase/phosphopantothenate--cysteine ligase
MAAAVADFRPKVVFDAKLKRRDGMPDLILEPTPDVLAELVALRRPGQVLVGFAAETNDPLANGQKKLDDKDCDLVVVNDVSQPGVGFGYDTNAVTILDRLGGRREVDLADKSVVANAVLDAALSYRNRLVS